MIAGGYDMFPKPNLFVSQCLGFAKCRWNGAVIPDEFVDKLKPFVEVITICPECEIGLGVPRDPIRIVLAGSQTKLMQLHTALDVTDSMNKFASDYLSALKAIDGFILKDRSPSCGLKEVKAYTGLTPGPSVMRVSGLFGRVVLEKYPYAAVATEARLTNFSIREHFLTRLFTLARFRKIQSDFLIKNLVQFHAEHKLLLMAYSQKKLRLMGAITANRLKKPPNQVFSEYAACLFKALEKIPKFTSMINALMHILGYFSEELKPEEKRFFLNTLEEYRREQIPFSVPANILYSYVVRFSQSYLRQQVFFEPYPHELLNILDSGKGRVG
jgi:uncharacterized protein YbgA (DUF1722 family)/uncharacterized protein YbbK (DUF523 family)